MRKTAEGKVSSIDTTEELILNENFGEEYGKLRRFRINYRNLHGHSNIEGTLYFPAEVDPYPILDEICEKLETLFKVKRS